MHAMKLLLGSAALLAASSAFAATSAHSVPVGAMSVTLPDGTVTPTNTSFALPLYDPPLAIGAGVGRIASLTATTITCTGAGWSAGALATAAFPYAFRIMSGNAAGATFLITANTIDTLTSAGADFTTLGIVTGGSGDSFKLIPIDTLMTLFGSTTLLGGTNATNADLVALSSSSQLTYYYNTTNSRWERPGVPLNFNDTRIPLDSVITIVRRSTALTLRFTGRVPDVRFRMAVANSGSTYTHTGFPTDVSLGALSLQTALPGWVTGPAATADILAVGVNGIPYYHDGTRWTRATVPLDFNNTNIPAGTPIQIFKRGVAGGTSSLTRNLPYSL
jgi:uncharacterized protein (TIGR02597 family)